MEHNHTWKQQLAIESSKMFEEAQASLRDFNRHMFECIHMVEMQEEGELRRTLQTKIMTEVLLDVIVTQYEQQVRQEELWTQQKIQVKMAAEAQIKEHEEQLEKQRLAEESYLEMLRQQKIQEEATLASLRQAKLHELAVLEEETQQKLQKEQEEKQQKLQKEQEEKQQKLQKEQEEKQQKLQKEQEEKQQKLQKEQEEKQREEEKLQQIRLQQAQEAAELERLRLLKQQFEEEQLARQQREAKEEAEQLRLQKLKEEEDLAKLREINLKEEERLLSVKRQLEEANKREADTQVAKKLNKIPTLSKEEQEEENMMEQARLEHEELERLAIEAETLAAEQELQALHEEEESQSLQVPADKQDEEARQLEKDALLAGHSDGNDDEDPASMTNEEEEEEESSLKVSSFKASTGENSALQKQFISLQDTMLMQPQKNRLFTKAQVRILVLREHIFRFFDLNKKMLGEISLHDQGVEVALSSNKKSPTRLVLKFYSPKSDHLVFYPPNQTVGEKWIKAIGHNMDIIFELPNLGPEDAITYYTLLGVDPQEEDLNVITQAFDQKIAQQQRGDDWSARKLQEGIRILSDPFKRVEYDNFVQVQRKYRFGGECVIQLKPPMGYVTDPVPSVLFTNSSFSHLYWQDIKFGRALTGRHLFLEIIRIQEIENASSYRVSLVLNNGEVISFGFKEKREQEDFGSAVRFAKNRLLSGAQSTKRANAPDVVESSV